MKRFKAVASLVLAAGLLVARTASAQSVTTGSISGSVTDESGGVLPGADVLAVHEPTRTRYTAVTDSRGRFSILNVRVGGPYALTVTMAGFNEQKRSSAEVALGADLNLDFRMKLESVKETVEVTANGGSILSPTSTGPASNVNQQEVEQMPTVTRSISDFARLSPYFAPQGNGGGDGPDVLAVAGRSNRYNNVQIDGANNNDLFGLAGTSGNPAGFTETQPISIDAIQEIQLVVAPYDVRQGGFSGGGINAITRTGTNEYHGTAYYEFRNDGLVGNGPKDRPISTFSEKQFGASLGGPIVRDKVFFFVNADLTRKEQPSGWSADGSSGQTFTVPAADLARFLNILQTKYNYDPSVGRNALGEFTRNIRSSKIFARLDFNLSDKHRLTIRNNWTKPRNDLGGAGPTNSLFITPDSWYQFNDKTNSTVAQLNSVFGNAVNEFRVNYQIIRDNREGATAFPQVTVDLTGGACGSATCQIRAGREQFSTANVLNQDIIEITDDFTMHRGNHQITIGTHNEFFKFENLFIRDNMGTYRFSSLDNFAAGLGQQFDYSFSATSDPKQAAKFHVNQLGFYAGDLWHLNSRFTLNYGLRFEVPLYPDTPHANPVAVANFGYRTDTTPSPKLWSPRVGFNYNLSDTPRQQIRGGLGIFSGRTPYVWISNQFGNTGIDFTRIGASFNSNNRVPFAADPNNQPKVVVGATGSSFTNEIDLVDPNFKYPQNLRGNLGYDRDLGLWGMIATVEGLYAKTLQDIKYQNLNRLPSGATRASDGRPIFTRKVTSLSDVIFLTNTTEGYSWTVSAKLERPFRNNLYFSASYLYGRAKSVMDGTSDQAASNWGNVYVPGDPNNPPLAESRYSPGHRINLALSYDFKLGKRLSLITSAFYNGQSGRPYTFIFLSDVNGDGRTSNDLVFVPSSADQVIVTNGTFDQLNTYINNDPALSKYRGQIVPRNAAFGPWMSEVDLSANLGVPFGGRRLEVKFDVLNFLNLFNKNWGVVNYAVFNDLAPIGVSIDSATGKYVYNLSTINRPTYVKFSQDDLRSRWQAALTFRVRF